MTLMRAGTGPASRRYPVMEKLDTSQTLRQLAIKMRRQARETALPTYQDMMNRVAETLDAEAELVAERQSMEFAHALQRFGAMKFTSYH
jgi:hypothetical protein